MIRTEKGYAQIYKIYGRSETEIKEKLGSILKKSGEIDVYTRRRGKEVHVLAEIAEQDEDSAKAKLKPVAKEIKKSLGTMFYSTKENETMEEAVVRLLTKYELTVTTAESCTGGMIASKIVNVPGASDVFNEGFITYSNKAKRKLLDVSKNTLKKYGAVSEQTVKEMALGGVLAADADACIAVTGIAGPDGGTEEKPVGLVYIGCCIKDEVTVKECHFHGTRLEIREQSANAALDLLRSSILNNYR
ncbi:MAG: nicotinamide-nucleotide amidohydrolase family protein [Lachnospiraceae bacterium]|nr:nicotinamide-nucleotide amidohydrolase family protein [Lachnospiraceae bacterium]